MDLQDIILDDPEPNPNEVILQIAACGFSRHDALIISGTLKRGVILPRVLGHEISGEIVEVGKNVPKQLIGEKAVVIPKELGHRQHGGFAEFVKVPFSSLIVLPSGYPSLKQASLLFSPISVAAKAVKLCDIHEGNSLVITGASGGLGVHAAQVAAAVGVKVLGITSSEKKITRLQSMPWYDSVFLDTEPYEEIIPSITDDEGASAAIDTTGLSLNRVLTTLSSKGKLIISGQLLPSPTPIIPAEIIFRELQLIGSLGAGISEVEQSIFDMQAGAIDAIIEKTLPLKASSLKTALDNMKANTSIGRILIDPQLPPKGE
ncbi:MAG: hypothetical protein CL763_04340 [Chloroflexi bacterium]|nr:hypothetical protein [Chloroflexota bacterium]